MLRNTSGRNLATEMNLSSPSNQPPCSLKLETRERSPTEVKDLAIGITTVHHAREVEHLGAVVYLRPEPVLQSLLLRLECRGRLDQVEVRQDRDDLGQAVARECRQRFERFLCRSKVLKMRVGRRKRRRTISNPKDPSTMSRTRSATLAVSIMDPRSLGHSMIVKRRFLPVIKISYKLVWTGGRADR